jgi:tetratricopeptide (TPR) repeat protein
VRQQNPQTWVFWIHASNPSRFDQSVREIADRLNLPGRQDANADYLQLLQSWLQNEENGRWLVILDNVDDASFLLDPSSDTSHVLRWDRFPQDDHGSIMITSRSKLEALKLTYEDDIVSVTAMSEDEAVELMQKKLGQHDDGIDELARALDFLPLAITQAASYIRARRPRLSARSYRQEIDRSLESRSSLLRHHASVPNRDREATNSVILTWQISFKHVHKIRRSAAELLALMSFCDRSSIPEILICIPYEVKEASISVDGGKSLSEIGPGFGPDGEEATYSGNPICEDQTVSDDGQESWVTDDSSDEKSEALACNATTFEEDIVMLRSYSFIGETMDSQTWEMHRLVQDATQAWAEAQGSIDDFHGHFLVRLAGLLPDSEVETWPVYRILYPHARRAFAQKPQRPSALRHWSSVMEDVGCYALEQGDYAAAEEMVRAAATTRSMLLGSKHAQTLLSRHSLAAALTRLGRWGEAEQVMLDLLQAAPNELGKGFSKEQVIGTLAGIYLNQGRFREAEQFGLQILEKARRVLGAEDDFTVTAMSILAQAYMGQGRYDEAEPLKSQTVEMMKKYLGAEHPDTLSEMGSLALLHTHQKRFDEAEQLGLLLVQTSKRVLGTEHHDTLNHMSNLTLAYLEQGRHAEADRINLQVVELRKATLGAKHISTLTTLSNLAYSYSQQGRYAEAEQLQFPMVETAKNELGKEHPFTLIAMSNLSITYTAQCRFAEAERLESEVLERRMEVLGAGHPDTLKSMNNLALAYSHQGRFSKAEQLQLSLLETTKNELGAEHPFTLVVMSNLAHTYATQYRFAEAEQLGLKVLEKRATVLAAGHPETLKGMNNLALAYSAQGRFTEAEQLLSQVLELQQEDGDHPDKLLTMTNLAELYHCQGQYDKAEQLGLQVVDRKMAVLGAEHPRTLDSMSNLAAVYADQGRYDEAEQLALKVLERRTAVLGAEHPETLVSINNLATTYSKQNRHDEAEKLELQVLKARTALLGSQHPHTLSSMNNLACTYSCQKQFAEAVQLQERAVEGHNKVLGPQHPGAVLATKALEHYRSELMRQQRGDGVDMESSDSQGEQGSDANPSLDGKAMQRDTEPISTRSLEGAISESAAEQQAPRIDVESVVSDDPQRMDDQPAASQDAQHTSDNESEGEASNDLLWQGVESFW